MVTFREMLLQESRDERQAIITNRLLIEIAGFRESAFRIHKQIEFAFLVRISQVEELFAVLCNRHHGPEVHNFAPQRAFGTLWVLYPLKPNSAPPGRLAH